MTHVSYSNIGRRAINQDYCYPIDDRIDSNLFMVCDGVGSSPFGEVASKEVCEAADRFFTERSYTRLSDINFDALAGYLRESIAQVEATHPEVKGMSTTIVFIYFIEGGAAIAWMGDSRLYHIRQGEILYMTQDHSLINDLREKGNTEVNEGRIRNFITRSMNTRTVNDFSIHLIPGADIQKGDYLFLCTDGVLENMTNEILARVLDTNEAISVKADMIISECIDKTSDNFTFQLIQI